MNKQPYANDWKSINKHTQYNESKKLYWSTQENPKGSVYCQLSADHNGITGIGLQLKTMLEE